MKNKTTVILIIILLLLGVIGFLFLYKIPEKSGRLNEEVKKLNFNEFSIFQECEYKKETVYYATSKAMCADCYSYLVDLQMDIICSPDGGLGGQGDGRCPGFSLDTNNCKPTQKGRMLDVEFYKYDGKSKYNRLQSAHSLKYITYQEAIEAFQVMANNKNIMPTEISFYVGGKLPREDGDPYFIGRGIIDKDENRCIKGYFNLISGEGKTWEDVCVIYN